MKKLILTIMFSLMICGAAYAAPADAPTDIFGNPIEWSEPENGDGEDNAGLETLEDTGETQEYSFGEQAEILGVMESAAAETTISEKTGYVSINLAEMPESWSEGNIKVTLYCGSRKEEIWLYRQSGWETKAELPEGIYTFYRAETPDGFQFSGTPGTIMIDNWTPVTLSLSPGVNIPEIYIDDANEETAPIHQEAEPDTKKNRMMVYIEIVAGVLVLILVVGGLTLPRRQNKNRNYRNDLLD